MRTWLPLLAMMAAPATTQCPDNEETLDLRIVLSDAQGFRRNDARWSLTAATSLDAYEGGALVGSGNTTLDAGRAYALPPLCATPGDYWFAVARLPENCVADIELVACDTPTPAPTALPSFAPSLKPTRSTMPSTASPTWSPTTLNATRAPSVIPSIAPTPLPSYIPSPLPSTPPSQFPTRPPTLPPSLTPTTRPSAAPSHEPSPRPTPAPAPVPTPKPTPGPSTEPTLTPSPQPTVNPTRAPVPVPTSMPSPGPSSAPVPAPTSVPTSRPSGVPSSLPVPAPSAKPTTAQPTTWSPSGVPTSPPSGLPSATPTPKPTPVPTAEPTVTKTPTRPGPCFESTHTQKDELFTAATVAVDFDLTTDATYEGAFCEVERANLTVALSGDFNNETEGGVREEAFLKINGQDHVTDRCTVPTECLDNDGGQTYNYRSAGYETCAPFRNISVTDKLVDGVLTAEVSASSAVDATSPNGCPAFARARLDVRYCCFEPSSAPTPGPTAQPSHTPSRVPTSPPSPPPSLPPSRVPTATPTTPPSSQPSPPPTPAPQTPTQAPMPVPTLLPTPSPTPKPSASFAPTRVPTAVPSSLPSPAPTPAPSASFAPTGVGRPSLRPTRLPTPVPTPRPSTSAPTAACLSLFPLVVGGRNGNGCEAYVAYEVVASAATFAGLAAADVTTAASKVFRDAIAIIAGVDADRVTVLSVAASARRRLADLVEVAFEVRATSAERATVDANLLRAEADPSLLDAALTAAAAASNDPSMTALFAGVTTEGFSTDAEAPPSNKKRKRPAWSVLRWRRRNRKRTRFVYGQYALAALAGLLLLGCLFPVLRGALAENCWKRKPDAKVKPGATPKLSRKVRTTAPASKRAWSTKPKPAPVASARPDRARLPPPPSSSDEASSSADEAPKKRRSATKARRSTRRRRLDDDDDDDRFAGRMIDHTTRRRPVDKPPSIFGASRPPPFSSDDEEEDDLERARGRSHRRSDDDDDDLERARGRSRRRRFGGPVNRVSDYDQSSDDSEEYDLPGPPPSRRLEMPGGPSRRPEMSGGPARRLEMSAAKARSPMMQPPMPPPSPAFPPAFVSSRPLHRD